MSESSQKLKRMRARLRGTVAAELPAKFTIRCECGSSVSGTRGKSWQESTCSECHTVLYLLPTNVYPSTDSVANDVIGGTFGKRLSVVLSEVIPRGKRKKKESKQTASSPKQDSMGTGSRKKKQPPPTTQGRVPMISLPRFNPVQAVRRIFTPIRLLVLGMLVAVGMTSSWRYHRNQMDAAGRVWRESLDAIPQLIAEGDFQGLQETLAETTHAGRLTGQRGAEWRRTVNLLEETQAVTAICYDTLPELLSEKTGSEASALAEVVGQYFVIDGYIDPVGDGSGSFVLDIPAMSGQQSVVVTLQLPPLADYLQTNPTQRFVFGFRLQGEVLSESNGEFHKLPVAPESFVLFTSAEHCDQLGMSVQADPALAEVLENQKVFVEESSRWETRHEERTQLILDAELRTER